MLSSRALLKLVSLRPILVAKNSTLTDTINELKKRGLKIGQGVDGQNIFKLFLVDEKFMIRDDRLKREFLNLQRQVHPDKYYSKQDCGDAVELSCLVNDAYQILRHPYKRAKHLVSLKLGMNPDEMEISLNSIKLDDDFLTRMMELREQVELTSQEEDLMRISADVDHELTQLTSNMSKNLDVKNTDILLKQLGKLKFLGSLHVKLSDRLENFSKF